MARLASFGYEMNTITASVEGTTSAVAGAPTIVSSIRGSGSKSFRVSGMSSGTQMRFGAQFKAADNDGPFYFRKYIKVDTAPAAPNTIMKLTGTGGTSRVNVKLNSDRTIELGDNVGAIANSPTALTLGTVYIIEVLMDRTPGAGASILTLRIGLDNGLPSTTEVTSSTRTIGGGAAILHVGGNANGEAQTVGDWTIDDVALNDNTGIYQNSYPGPASIFHMLPDSAGDVNTFATQTGGTAGAANNFTRVNEATPDDATTFNGSNTLNQEDMFNVAASPVSTPLVIKFVAVGLRLHNPSADAVTAIKAQIKKAASGTILQSAAIIPNNTTWRTNGSAAPFLYPIVAYTDPDGADWTLDTLNSMQIGYILSTGGTNRIDVSSVWAHVEVAPRAPARTLLGAGV